MFRKGQWVLVGDHVGIHVVGNVDTMVGEVHLVNGTGETTTILPNVAWAALAPCPMDRIPKARLVHLEKASPSLLARVKRLLGG